MSGERALTYVEVDVDYCANTYGVAPCLAALAGSFIAGSGLSFDFSTGVTNGFAGENATLVGAVGGATLTPTGNDPMLRRTGLSIVGATEYLVQIDVERVTARSGTATWQGSFFFVNGSHPESGSFRESFAETGLENVGDRAVILMDLSTLTIGGTDWITGTTTAIRFDFDNVPSGVGTCGTFKIHSIAVGHLASAGEATGTDKCYNSLKTCQDRLNFVNEPVTLRFAQDTLYLPTDIFAFPMITSVSFQPATISLGKDLGQRATLTVTFRDRPHSDTGPGFDKYYAERDYDPWSTGSFWGKFRARQPYLKGRPLRLIRGFLGDALADMETRHYIIESFNGPTPKGEYTLVAKDVLKLADGDRAKAPLVSNGFLVAAIDDNDLSCTLSPSGIGNAEYPSSGYVAIGGEEIVSFTRSGDVLTIVRAQQGTEASAHDAQDRVQLCKQYDGEDPADIIYDLFTTYANIPASYISLTDWRNETGSFLQRVYTTTIADPVPVKQLVSELIEQAALAMWWDDSAQLIRLKVLRGITTDAAIYDDNNILEGSLQTQEQPGQRVSQVWTYYGLRNPLRPLDEPDNFRSTLATVNLQAETDEGQAAITTIYSRWIPAFGRDTADRLNDILLGRFQVPPRRFNFSVFRGSVDPPLLGSGYQVGSWAIQDAAGRPAFAPIQITRLNALSERFDIEAEEMLFETLDPADLINRTIIIDSNAFNVNFRTLHDSLYPEPEASGSPTITVTCIVETGVIVGSTDTVVPAFDVGTWPVGVNLIVQVNGRIQGKGGDGGGEAEVIGPAESGGTALYSRQSGVILDMTTNGEIWGGGGGGGAGIGKDESQVGGGGGGAGQVPGAGGVLGTPGEAGTTEAGGGGGSDFAGDGGDPGQAGDPAALGGTGGAAGAAIDGVSFFVIVNGPGDRRGAEVN